MIFTYLEELGKVMGKTYGKFTVPVTKVSGYIWSPASPGTSWDVCCEHFGF